MEADLGAQLVPSNTHIGPATNCESLCSPKQVTQVQLQAESDTDLHQSPSQEAPEPTQPPDKIPLSSQAAYLKGYFGKHQTLLR